MPDIKAELPDAQIGYRGSLTTGQRHNNNNPIPFNPNDFDVDAFIVDDDFAALFSSSIRFRDARKRGSSDIVGICDDLELDFQDLFPGYRIEINKPFTFRVWTQAEFQSRVVPYGYKLIE